MKKSDFIQVTRAMIKAGVFTGRSDKLQFSLTLLMNALENNSLIESRHLSAQVSTGVYVSRHAEAGSITPAQAWNYLYKEIGRLEEHYKKEFHERMTLFFNIENVTLQANADYGVRDVFNKGIDYTPELKQEMSELWSAVLSRKVGPDLESPYANLSQFIDDMPPSSGSSVDNQDRLPSYTTVRPSIFQDIKQLYKKLAGNYNKTASLLSKIFRYTLRIPFAATITLIAVIPIGITHAFYFFYKPQKENISNSSILSDKKQPLDNLEPRVTDITHSYKQSNVTEPDSTESTESRDSTIKPGRNPNG